MHVSAGLRDDVGKIICVLLPRGSKRGEVGNKLTGGRDERELRQWLFM